MFSAMMLPVLAGFLVAVTLSGCGSTTVSAPVPVLNQLVGGVWQNLRMLNHTALAEVMPACNFYEYSDLAKKVPDECCDISKWPAEAKAELSEPSTMIHDGNMHNCFVEEMHAAPLFVRNYLGCEDGELIGASACMPDGVALAEDPHGYPMNTTFAATTWQNGTFDSCQCSNKGKFEYPARLAGGVVTSPSPPTSWVFRLQRQGVRSHGSRARVRSRWST